MTRARSLLILVISFVVVVLSATTDDGTWLAALYNATVGAQWTTSCRNGWNTSQPSSVCVNGSSAWYGVTCGPNNTVVAVNLAQCNLSGTLPDLPLNNISAGAMSALMNLSFANNSVRGSLPNGWSVLSQLQTLDSSWNVLNGTLPDVFSNWSSLRQFDLHNNSFNGSLPLCDS